MKIHLRKGIDSLIFGKTRTEIEEVMGKPDREITDPDDDNDLVLEYTEHKLRLTFYQNEGDRLGYLRCSNPHLTIFDRNIIDCKIEEVMNQINPEPDAWEKEDFFTFTTYFLKDDWLTLNVEYESITDIELGVPFKDNDEYDWPK